MLIKESRELEDELSTSEREMAIVACAVIAINPEGKCAY